MADTTGYVFDLLISADIAQTCAIVGMTQDNAEALLVHRLANDDPATGAFKNSLVDMLSVAFISQRVITVTHGDTDSFISSITAAST